VKAGVCAKKMFDYSIDLFVCEVKVKVVLQNDTPQDEFAAAMASEVL